MELKKIDRPPSTKAYMRKGTKGGSGSAHGCNEGRMGNIHANDLQHNRMPTWQWEMRERVGIRFGGPMRINVQRRES